MVDIQRAMPEFITRNDRAPQNWSVQEGAPVRGDAWTDMRAGQMRVPFGADELSRVVRAHELMHSKVSPTDMESIQKLAKRENLLFDLLISAEEFRVNMLISEQGFDADELADGSESKTGKILGENKDWNGLVRFIPAVAGTKAGKDFLRGMKTSNPAFEEQGREIQKALTKMWRTAKKATHVGGVKRIASTKPYEIDCVDGESVTTIVVPKGFVNFTIPVARYLQSLLIAENSDGTPDEYGEEVPVNVKQVNKHGRGVFANLILQELPKPNHVDGRIGRKRMATNIGRNPRRINRMLVDPERRIFDKRAKGKGGIVLIDQSGSMNLSDEDIWEIVNVASGCVIIGYSHKPKSDNIPNVWVIADRGKVADKIPHGNGGNGVDGPAIRFAQSKRKNGEPFIWVCDGCVTDGDTDGQYPNLTKECADLVSKFGIHMVENMEGAVEAMKQASRGERLRTKGVGQIKHALRNAGHDEDESSEI